VSPSRYGRCGEENFFPMPGIDPRPSLYRLTYPSSYDYLKKVNISLLQAVEAPRVASGRASHIT
jgi:hypothetical protein